MGAFHKLRLTAETADIARQAVVTGELVELRNRRGEIQRVRVHHFEYEFGIDAGFYAWVEYQDEMVARDVLSRVLQGGG